MKEVSAGGVVIFGNTVLILKKYNGDYVLPKGRIEEGEVLEETALREVYEETGIRGEIILYIGKGEYRYRNIKKNFVVNKEVYWYLMKALNHKTIPQKSEGFVEATFTHQNKALFLLKHEDEKKIVKEAIEHMRVEENK